MRRRFFAFALLFLPCVAWLGCEWATERTPEPRPITFGAEVIVNIRGQGSIVSDEAGIRCPEVCYTRIVSNIAAEAAPRSIALRAKPDPGYRFARWEVDGSRVAGQGSGPDECNPVRRPAETPALGSAAEVALGFGEVDGYPPPGMSERCASYSRVPVAYNLTAVFESTATTTPNDVWATLTGVSTATRLEDLMVTSERVFARAVDPMDRWGVVMVDRQVPSAVTFLPLQIDSNMFDLTHHIVWQDSVTPAISLVRRDNGGFVSWTPSPSKQCLALSSTSTHVFCRTFDQELVRWQIDGTNQTSIAAGLPLGGPMIANGSRVLLVDDGAGSGPATIRSLTTTGSPDAGAPTLTTIASNLATPRDLRADGSFVYAVVGDSSADVMRFTFTPSTPATYRIGSFLLLYVPETSGANPRVWTATEAPDSTWQIASQTTANVRSLVRAGLRPVTGLALDAAYVYWTQGDVRIYRGRR